MTEEQLHKAEKVKEVLKILEPLVEPEWQPIETAPVNEWVLGYEEDTESMASMIFDSHQEELCPEFDAWTDGYRKRKPTHWKPLPDSPKK